MAGWNGAGIFEVNYIFTQDAANGINILASKQDTQWATVAAGLMLCQTRDGQNKPIADWDLNGFRMRNAGAPTDPNDYARLADITSVPAGEWIAETNAFTFVNATSFKLTGANLTARYQVGRRLKITHNTGGTTSYYTITASVFAAGDTTVTVSGPTLVTTVTAVSYAMLDAANLSLPVPSATAVYCGAGAAQVNGTDYVIGGSVQYPATLVTGDIYSELSAGVFTAKYAGLYLIQAAVAVQGNVGDTVFAGDLRVQKNGANLHPFVASGAFGGFDNFNGGTPAFAHANLVDFASLAAGDNLRVKANVSVSAPPAVSYGATAIFLRVR